LQFDHQSKSVFNGSDLGKQGSAKMMSQRCSEKIVIGISQKADLKGQFHSAFQKKLAEEPIANVKSATSLDNKIFHALIDPTLTKGYYPIELKFPKRKPKRKRQSGQL
jgi:hypothetical protein